MKKSEFVKEIKNYIYEILSEELEEVTMVGPDTEVSDIPSIAKSEKTNPATVKAAIDQAKKTKQAVAVAESEEDQEPTKAELAKEKVKGAPSKFKVSTDDFEDFKTKLKTLVKKIKDMEKGAERDKKMAALKQFIKKPELVKAFKERDVQIDTGGLVGENLQERLVWKSSEYEEMQSAIDTIFDNIGYLKIKDENELNTIHKGLDKLQDILHIEGVEERDVKIDTGGLVG